MSDMVERVAKAIFEHWFCGDWPPEREVDLSMGAEDFRAAAREVIAAMREPTGAMSEHLTASQPAETEAPAAQSDNSSGTASA